MKLKNQAKVAVYLAIAGYFVMTLNGCGGGGGSGGGDGLPRLSEAQPGNLGSCTGLMKEFTYVNTTIASAELVPADGLAVAGVASIPGHCLVRGEMNRRTSAVDGESYAIGFEMRLPTAWNGRYYYQANGGIDGAISTAVGGLGGAPVANALTKGFAVISSDAGHSTPAPFFGLDPQARLDYGYKAVGTLTPMAKDLVKAAYGRLPDRSYIGGCSNGGRHTMVAAARYADEYDGFLVGAPGFHLPKAAVEQLWKAQQYARIATGTTPDGLPDITTAVTPDEFKLLGKSILAKCDMLDGVQDDIVLDVIACQTEFDLQRDVPTCALGASRDGRCLSDAQQNVLAKIFAGSSNSAGQPNYSRFFIDPGVAAVGGLVSGVGSNSFAYWHYIASTERDPGAVAFIFNTPPMSRADFLATTGPRIALTLDIDDAYRKIFATDATYAESAWSFMTPPDETNLKTLRERGAKLVAYHGTADGVFSSVDTIAWYDGLKTGTADQTEEYARLFLVPGMSHCSNGPATDQFDMLEALVGWVEKGQAPEQVIASARGANANVPNTDLPVSWDSARTRPLCPYPGVARYDGSGDIEDASSFTCR
jgi:feruloyl esterase